MSVSMTSALCGGRKHSCSSLSNPNWDFFRHFQIWLAICTFWLELSGSFTLMIWVVNFWWLARRENTKIGRIKIMDHSPLKFTEFWGMRKCLGPVLTWLSCFLWYQFTILDFTCSLPGVYNKFFFSSTTAIVGYSDPNAVSSQYVNDLLLAHNQGQSQGSSCKNLYGSSCPMSM